MHDGIGGKGVAQGRAHPVGIKIDHGAAQGFDHRLVARVNICGAAIQISGFHVLPNNCADDQPGNNLVLEDEDQDKKWRSCRDIAMR